MDNENIEITECRRDTGRNRNNRPFDRCKKPKNQITVINNPRH